VIRLAGLRVQRQQINLATTPTRIVEVLYCRRTKPLGHKGRFSQTLEELVRRWHGREQRRVQAGTRQIHFEENLTLKLLPIPINTIDAANKKSLFKIIEMFPQRVFGDVGCLGKIIHRDLTPRTKRKQTKQSIEFLSVIHT